MKQWPVLMRLAIFGVGTVFPAFKSVEALESQTGLDDCQWLTYWILSAGISIVERFLGGVLYRLPFFTEIKLIFLMWLVLPYFKGAAALYEFFRPQINKSYSVVRQNVDELKGAVGSAGNEGKVADLRLRMSNVKSNIHQTLAELFQQVSTGKLEPSEFEQKLAFLDGFTGGSSAKSGRSTYQPSRGDSASGYGGSMRHEKSHSNPAKGYESSARDEYSNPVQAHADTNLPSKPGSDQARPNLTANYGGLSQKGHDQGRPDFTANYGGPEKGYEHDGDDGDVSAMLVANAPS